MKQPSAKRLVSVVLGLLVPAALAAGPGGGVPGSLAAPRSAPAAEEPADWTLMIYDVADTSKIAEIMVRNLAAFADLPPMSNVNIVALVDLPERNDAYAPRSVIPGLGMFTTAKLIVLEGGRYHEIRDLGEISMGRPDTLAGFIEEAADRFPAEKYGLVLSDHGGAYSGGYRDIGPPGAAQLSVEGMRTGMLAGMQRAGIDRFDLLNHDSCLMSSYEVVSALAPLADVMVGSEELTFGDNTLTPEAIASLGEDVSATEWGQVNIEEYAEHMDRDSDGLGAFSALSVIDGDQVARLDAAVESFADVAAAHMAEIGTQVGLARSRALEFSVGPLGSDSSMDAVDLGDFLRHLDHLPAEVEVARDAVYAALDASVVGQVTRPATQQATGLNVFFPSSPDGAGRYLGRHMGPAGWSRFVEAYASASGESGDAAAVFLSGDAEVLDRSKSGIRIAGQLAAGDELNVTGTETQVFTRIDGRDALAVVLPAYLNSGGVGRVQGVWDYAATTLTDGSTSAPASAIYQAQSGGLVGSFWAKYRDPSGGQTEVVFRVLLDSGGEIQSVSVADASQDVTAGLDLEVGGTLTPYLVVPSNGSYNWVPSGRSIRVTRELRVDYPQLPAGTPFEMGLIVIGADGGGDSASTTGQVPEGRAR